MSAMLTQLALRNPELAARLLAQQGVDLSTMQGGVGSDVVQGSPVGDVLTGPAPAPTAPPVPVGRPVPRPEGQPVTEEEVAAAAAAAAQEQQRGLAGLGQALQPATPPRPATARGANVNLSRGLPPTGGVEAMLGIAGQQPQGSIPLGMLLRGVV